MLRLDAETGCYPVSTDTELDNIKEAHHNGKVSLASFKIC